MIVITKLELKDCRALSESFAEIGWSKQVSLFEKYTEEENSGLRFCFVAFYKNSVAGYVTLLRNSKYEHFASENIFEISDLNVLPKYRNQGIATALIAKCEETAKISSNKIGLGVGLTSDYSNALRLYLKLGYRFDDNGLAYEGKTLKYQQQTICDDELNLYLIKNL